MGQQDYAAVLQKVKAAAPDMFYVSLQNADAGSRMISQARKAGVTAQIMSQDAVRHQRFIKSAWKAAEGVYFTFAKIDRDRPEYRNFAALYRKLGYGEPGSYSASAYDAALVLLTAIRKAGGAAPDAIRDQLLAMDVEGASKRILFRNNGDTEAAYVVQRVENGRFVDVWAP
jgi:branched-chain amino acid transport system substrate-binding protein